MTHQLNLTLQEPFFFLRQHGFRDHINGSYNNSRHSDMLMKMHALHSPGLERASRAYMNVHGYISILVCIFGISTNIINIFVLTRRHMRTAINCILTCMAVSDLLTMVSYVPFAMHFYCIHPPELISEAKNSYQWASYLLFHINFSTTTHTISNWLGVSLAVIRYKQLTSPAKGLLTRMRRLIRARVVGVIVFCATSVLMIPNYLSNKLETFGSNSSVYFIANPMLEVHPRKPIMMANMILYSVFAKLLPCVLMAVYCGLLLRTLNHPKFRRTWDNDRRRSSGYRWMQRPLRRSQTTLMLLVIIVMFLLTELPQSILIILSVPLDGFFESVYIPLGDVMDIIALLTNAINFVLYCSMSLEFRNTLVKICCACSSRHTRKTSCTESRLEMPLYDLKRCNSRIQRTSITDIELPNL